MSRSLPYSMQDVAYDNAKFRQRSVFKVQFVKIEFLVCFGLSAICPIMAIKVFFLAVKVN